VAFYDKPRGFKAKKESAQPLDRALSIRENMKKVSVCNFMRTGFPRLTIALYPTNV